MRASPRLCVCALALAVTTAPGSARALLQPPRNLALLIGIDDYLAVTDLKGCANDVARFKATLIGKFNFAEPDIVVLRNAQATREGILAGFESLIARAQPGDAVVIHYSGHGSRVQDVSADEDDGWDETIVSHDSRQAGVFDITDDEINALLGRLTAKTPNVTVVLDSCHSGSATRGGVDTRRAPDDQRAPPAPVPAPAAINRAAEGADDFRQKDAAYALITGSRPHELSNEFDVDGLRQGALTHFLTRALLAAPADATYRSVMETVAANVTNAFPSQHPQLEGERDRVIFGVRQIQPTPYLLASPQGSAALIDGGRLHGLAPGSELDVYPPGTLEFRGAALARLRVKGGDNPLQSEADIIQGGPIATASRAVVRSRTYPDAKLRIFLSPPETPLLAEASKALREFAGLEVVTDERLADLRVRHERNLIFTESADLIQMSAPIPADTPDVVARLVSRATTWMRWFALLRLEPSDALLPVALTLGDGSTTRFESGAKVQVTVKNASTQPAFLTLLNLDADGAVVSLGRPEDLTDPLAPSQTRTRTIQFTTPDGRTFVPDVLKAILTTSPVDPAIFTQAAARLVDPGTAPRRSPFEQLGSQTAKGQSRAATLVETSSWGAATARVETWQARPAGTPQPTGLPETPRLEGFILHFPEGTRTAPSTIDSRGLTQCKTSGEQLDDCWSIAPMGPSSPAIEVRRAGRSSQSRSPRSIGAAWDEAARLQSLTGAEFVEPVFEISLDDANLRAARSGSNIPDKDGAKKDTEWSLKHVNAFGARAQLRTDLNRPQDAEAIGVIVAHPDTGYRQHPEFWNSDAVKSAVMFESGWNFVENNNLPLDPLITEGSLPNPGHGTKSGSVIVSAPGKQWTGGSPNEFVTGVAPGARLVPLRVHTSVVHINPSNLAMAINHAAEPDGQKIRLPPGETISVISISMGGLPSLGLYRAVRHAERQGVILISAAGNNVGTVVWPARFDSAVAIAATNVECGTWPESSRGDSVDLAAPGESVWHAGVTDDGGNAIALGQGTTYATATTAGVAALWVSKHRETPLFAQIRKDGRLTEAFRAAAQKTSWRPGASGNAAPPPGITCAPGTNWEPDKYGAGIVNADRLLREPLVHPPGTRALDEPPFPLFQSLFPSGVPSATVEDRLRALFPGTPPATLVPLQAELTTLYALDPEVQATIDPLTTRAAPQPAAYSAARSVLLRKDVSTALAAAARRAQ